MGKSDSILHDFNELLLPGYTPTQELKQRSMFFVLLALQGLFDNYSHVWEILGSSIVPNITSTCSTFSHVPSKKNCYKLGHKIYRCYASHGCPHQSIAVVQHDHPSPPSNLELTSFDTMSPFTMFNEFLKWYEDHYNPIFTGQVHLLLASFMNLGFLTQVTPIILHVINLCFLLCLIFIDNVLYILDTPFNLLSTTHFTRSLNYVISFTKDVISLQDQSLGQMIDTRCESQGLYHLRASTHVDTIVDSPSLNWVILVLPKCNNLFRVCQIYLVCLMSYNN